MSGRYLVTSGRCCVRSLITAVSETLAKLSRVAILRDHGQQRYVLNLPKNNDFKAPQAFRTIVEEMDSLPGLAGLIVVKEPRRRANSSGSQTISDTEFPEAFS